MNFDKIDKNDENAEKRHKMGEENKQAIEKLYESEKTIEYKPIQEATVYKWPQCQPCMQCRHGWVVCGYTDNDGPLTYVCDCHYAENDGADCPRQEQ